jgi:hypothetical protein
VKRSFAWCSTGGKIDDSILNNTEYWANKQIPGEDLTPKKCLSLNFNLSLRNVGLVQSQCDELSSLLCVVFINLMESFTQNDSLNFSLPALQAAAQLSAQKMYVTNQTFNQYTKKLQYLECGI